MTKKLLLALLLSIFVGVTQVQAEGAKTRIISNNNTYSVAGQNERADLSIGLQTNNTVPNGKIQILIFAGATASEAAQAADGQADVNAFDIGGATAACPASIPGVFDFTTVDLEPAATANFIFTGGYYHVLTCAYTGTGDMSQANFGYSGNSNYFLLNNIINPMPDLNDAQAQVLYAPIWIRQVDGNDQIYYNSLQTVTSSRNVQVTATIQPQITMILSGLPANNTYCGALSQQTTTGFIADFGVVNNTNFTNVAQKLDVVTNARDGYTVSVIEDDQMSFGNGAHRCPAASNNDPLCISNAQVNNMSSTNEVPWTTPNQGQGLAFTLENNFGNDTVFDYTTGYRHFADAEDGDAAVVILDAAADVVQSSNNICYRLVGMNYNQNGFYSNQITYTLTLKF